MIPQKDQELEETLIHGKLIANIIKQSFPLLFDSNTPETKDAGRTINDN